MRASWFVPGRMLQKVARVREIVEVAEKSKMKAVEATKSHSDEGVRAVADVF